MKITVFNVDKIEEDSYKKLENENLEFVLCSDSATIENVGLAQGSQAICIRPYHMGKDQIQAYYDAGVRLISTRTVGYDHIDVEAAKEIGMKVSNTGYSAENVAEYTVMMMLMCLRNIKLVMNNYMNQRFSIAQRRGSLMKGKTIGVIGTGKIGTAVINILSSFGCEFLAYDCYKNPALEEKIKYVTLEELLSKSDIVTLHASANKENYHLIDAKGFELMKKSAIVVNASRGSLIDTEALIEALENERIAGAGLDVLEDEESYYYMDYPEKPIKNRNIAILKSMPNVITTAHMAFYTDAMLSESLMNAIEACVDIVNGKKSSFEIA